MSIFQRPEEALKEFDALVQRYPASPRAQYGKAQALDALSEKKQSNEFLERAIAEYQKVSVAWECVD